MKKEICVCDDCKKNKEAITKCESCGKDLCEYCNKEISLNVKTDDRDSDVIYFSLYLRGRISEYDVNNKDIKGYILCSRCRERLEKLMKSLYKNGDRKDIVIGIIKNLKELAKTELL